MDFLPEFTKLATSPIWFLAIVVFGGIYYFQWAFGQIEKAPKNLNCQHCDIKVDRYFPNTKFCVDCFHNLRDELQELTGDLEAAREKVAKAADNEEKIGGYDAAIQCCKAMIEMKERYPKHGLRISDNIPEVLESGIEERGHLARETRGSETA